MKKIILFTFTFFCCFLFSSRAFASEFVRLSLNDSYLQFVRNDSPITWRIDSQHSTNKLGFTNRYYYTENGSSPIIDALYMEINNNNGFLAHKEYQLSIVLNSNYSNLSELFPYLVYLPNNYSLDSNILFNDKNVKFCQDSECTSYFTRQQMNLSYFSMGYSDNEVNYIYTLNFTFVSPYPFDHLEFRLYCNTSLVNQNNNNIWTLKNGNTVYLDMSSSMLVYDYYDFQGVPNDNVCVGDECINHYEPEDSVGNNPNINTSVNINDILGNVWSGITSFVSASIYVISLIGILFTGLPPEVKSLLLFCFSLGIIIIIWKVLKI